VADEQPREDIRWQQTIHIKFFDELLSIGVTRVCSESPGEGQRDDPSYARREPWRGSEVFLKNSEGPMSWFKLLLSLDD
jgi:hypothetical protein